MKQTLLAVAFIAMTSIVSCAQGASTVARLEMPVKLKSATTCGQDSRIAAVGVDGNLYLWDLPTSTPRHLRPSSDGLGGFVTCSLDGKWAALVPSGQSILVVDVANGKVAQKFDVGAQIQDATLSPEGALIAIATNATPTQLWDVRSGKKLATGKRTLGASAATTFSPDGKFFLSADQDTMVRAYDLTGKCLYESDAGLLEPFGVSFAPDGKQFAVAGAEGSVMLFDANSGKRLKTSNKTGNPIFGLMMSPDGKSVGVLELDDFSMAPVAFGMWNTTSSEVGRTPVDPKSVIGGGRDKSHLILLKVEDPKTLAVLAVQ